MKTNYRIKFSMTLTLTKGTSVAATPSPDIYDLHGELEREEDNGLSTEQSVHLASVEALAPVIPSDGSQEYKGVMGAVEKAAKSIAEVLSEQREQRKASSEPASRTN